MLMFASIMESAKLNPYENINNNTLPNKLNKSNGKNTEDDKDKNIEKIKSDKIKNNLNVVKSWEAIKIQRFDPTNLKSSQKFELSSVEAKERNEAAAIAVKKLLAAEKAVEKAGKVAEVRKAEVTATEEISAGGFANLDELKNIFYKEVSWCVCKCLKSGCLCVSVKGSMRGSVRILVYAVIISGK